MTNPSLSVNPHDLFQLGDHRLLCDNCCDPEAVKRLVGSDKITSVICDPPFGVNLAASKAGFKQKLSMPKDIIGDHLQTDAEYQKFSQQWLEAVIPHLARKNSIYTFNADKMIFSLRAAMLGAGCKVSQILVWVKSQSVVGRLDYNPRHELILYSWFGTHQYLKSKDQSVLFYPKPAKSKFHPSTKPIPLIRHLILNNTKINDFIFDGFIGSGTAILSAQNTGRKCLGMEIDPAYCTTTIQRWQQMTGKKAIKLSQPKEVTTNG